MRRLWPERPLGGGEKLFFDESDIRAIRRRVEEHAWAARILGMLEADARAGDAAYRRFHDGRPREPYFVQSTWVRDVALCHRITGEAYCLGEVREDFVSFFGLDRMGEPLFGEARPPTWMSCGFQLIPRLAAYDLLRRHPLFAPLGPDMEARIAQCRDWVRLALDNWGGRTGALYNTTTWLIAAGCVVGFLTGEEEDIRAAVDTRPYCFKAFLGGFRDRLFWPEPLDYALGYTLSCLLIIAELYRKHGREDLYAYADPVTGAGLRTFVDGAITQCYADGRLATAGDESQQAAVVAPGQSGRSHLEDVYLFRDRSPLSRYKLDMLHAAYGDATFAWLIAQDPARAAYDNCFWGYVALTHGQPLEPQTPPPASSGVYPGIGTAILRADETSSYWNSDAPTVFVRSGRFYHSHVHFDAFSLVLNAFGKNIFPDWFIPWDYLAPRDTDGFANQCPFTRGPMGHNTVAVDRTPFVLEYYNNFAFQPEMSLRSVELGGGRRAQVVTVEGDFFGGVRQRRTVALTDRYVLDLFTCESDAEHTYDYCLHSFGRLDLAGVGGLSAYDGFAADYRLPPIDKRSARPDNAWLRPGMRGSADGAFSATFLDRDAIGVQSLFRTRGAPLEVFTTDTPYYVSGEGYDDLPWDGEHRRMPMLILRRVGRSATFAAVHQPFRFRPATLAFGSDGNAFVVESHGLRDEIAL